VAVAAVILLGRTLAGSSHPAPDLRLPLPEFELEDSRGGSASLQTMRGKVWVASFIFTSCPSVCPKIMQRMAQIQEDTDDVGDRLLLVSVTVDPENDTPARLVAYGERFGAEPSRWKLWTGPVDQITNAVVDGFKIMMGKQETNPGIFEVVHGERLVLVDGEGNIRGFYEANDEGIAELVADARAVLEES